MLFRSQIGSCGGVVHFRRVIFIVAVHILFTFTAFRPASGLRLEITTKIDKKKPELYFLSRIKKILTEKLNGHCPEHDKIHPCTGS
jgi:hypothetical protein